MAGLVKDNAHLLLLPVGSCQCIGDRADSSEVVVWVLHRSLLSIAVNLDEPRISGFTTCSHSAMN